MNTTTTNINFKIKESHPPNFGNRDIVTDTNNIVQLKSKINRAMHTRKPIIYLNVKMLNKSCLEVLKIAKQCNVSVVFINNKAINEIEPVAEPPKQENNSIKLRLEDGIRILKLKDIIRLQAVSNYTFFFTTLSAKPFISSKTLKFYQQLLDEQQFVRTHRTHLVNKAFVQSYFGGTLKKLLLSNNDEIEISRRKLSAVLKNINTAG